MDAKAKAVWLYEVDAGTDCACWFVANRVDEGAVPFIPLTDHEAAMADSEKARKKAVQQLAETNRQLQSGMSMDGHQFYGTPADVEWLQRVLITMGQAERADLIVSDQLSTLLTGLEALAGELDLQKFNYAADRIRTLTNSAKGGDE